MLPHKHRLMLRHFPEFFSQSKKLYSPFYTIFYLAQESIESTGAVVVPKKVVAKAAYRNKLKRQTLEVLYPLLKTHPHLKVAIRVKKPLDKNELSQLSIDLEKTLTSL